MGRGLGECMRQFERKWCSGAELQRGLDMEELIAWWPDATIKHFEGLPCP